MTMLHLVACLMLPSGALLGPAEDFGALLSMPTPPPARALAEAGASALPQIEAALATKTTVAPLMAQALADHPVPEARGLLEAALGSGDQRLGYWAAKALGALRDPASVPALSGLLPVKEEAKSYWEIGYFGGADWVTIWTKTYQPDGTVTITQPPSGCPNIRVAFAALEALGQIGGPEAREVLTRFLGSNQWLLRSAAVAGLARCGDASSGPLVLTLAMRDETLAVRTAAREALSRLQGTWTPPQPIGEPAVPAIAFLKTAARTRATLGFEDSYPFPKTPWYHWGENVFTLTPPRPDGELRNLTNLRGCRVQGLEVSPDAKRLLFSVCDDNVGSGFHVCEIGVDGTGFRQITNGNCNDVDPCYLPDGRIAFSSDRAGYQEYYHQERSRSIYAMAADGSGIQQLTFNPNQDYDPLPLSDGRIAYTSYRFYGQDGSGDIYHRGSDLNRIETQLRAMNPDGSGDRLLYGAMRGGFYVPLGPLVDSLQDSGSSWVRGESEHIGVSVSWVREMAPGRLVCCTPAGLTMVEPAADALACEVPLMPEILNLAGGEEVYIYAHDELNPVGRWTSPYPVDERRVLVAHAPWWNQAANAYGLYLMDLATREMTLIYDDPMWGDVDPIPLVPRPVPALAEPNLARSGKTAVVLCQSVFTSDRPYDHAAARYVRVLGATLMPLSLNANAAFESRVLGTVPLQTDGSFHVEVPADRPVRFQVLDGEGNVLLHETEFNYLRPGERTTCVGCHEPKGKTPSMSLPLASHLPPYPTLGGVDELTYHGRVNRGYSRIARP